MSSPRDMRKGFGLVLGTLAIVIVALFLIIFTGGSAQATNNDKTEWVTWILPETVTELPAGNTPAIWPQKHAPDGVVPCGRFAQIDLYKSKDVPALIADGWLTEGEDYKVVKDWYYVYGGDCAPPEPITVPASLDHTDVCGPDYALNAPVTDELVKWEVDTSGIIEGAGEAVVTATALTDRPLQITPGETATTFTWTYSFTSEACETEPTPPVVVPPVDPPKVVEPPVERTLAHTGTSELLPLIGIAGGLLLASGGLILRAVRRHV